MGLDIRIPIGAMFALFGAILVIFGAVADPKIYEKSLGININVWWGLVMLAFGVIMLLLGRRAASATHSSSEPQDDQRTAARRGH